MKKVPLWWKMFPWVLAIAVLGVGFAGVAQYGNVHLIFTTLYGIFPLLGISAWSIMWTHYVIGEVRRLNPTLPKNMVYHHMSSYFVLAAILLHPGFLYYAQYKKGFGLPPGSVISYVGELGMLAASFGILALLIFLSFEIFVRTKENQVVKRWWWLVNISQTVAMYLIFYHSLTIGSHLHGGWFRTYWIALGVVLLPLVLHVHWNDLRGKTVE